MNITRFIIDNALKTLTIELSTSEQSINDNAEAKQLSFEYLRISSPENQDKKSKNGQSQIISHKKNVVLVNIESVAKHGYRFIFDDGHSAIYSEKDIQVLIVEYKERWQHYLQNLKASGHSREATIDIKQL